jgi:hypothetical protein
MTTFKTAFANLLWGQMRLYYTEKFYSERNPEQIEVMECLLSFGAESFVFQFDAQKYEDYDIQNYNFACCCEWPCFTHITQLHNIQMIKSRRMG